VSLFKVVGILNNAAINECKYATHANTELITGKQMQQQIINSYFE